MKEMPKTAAVRTMWIWSANLFPDLSLPFPHQKLRGLSASLPLKYAFIKTLLFDGSAIVSPCDSVSKQALFGLFVPQRSKAFHVTDIDQTDLTMIFDPRSAIGPFARSLIKPLLFYWFLPILIPKCLVYRIGRKDWFGTAQAFEFGRQSVSNLANLREFDLASLFENRCNLTFRVDKK